MARAMKDSGIEWIGEIPEGWEVARISSCFSEIKEKNTDSLYDNALQFKMGRIIPKPRKWDAEEIGETYSAYTIVHPGTIMVNGLNLEFDFVTQRVAIVEENGIITSAYIAMSPNDSVDADYMCYLLKAYDYRRALHNMGKGLRKILNYSELKTKPILLPPLSEQRFIVKVLNAECARIDAVIEQTRTSIEEYKKLKQSVITQAVTKGIRPGRKMKDSGVEWIGEIASLFYVFRLKHLLRAPLQYGANESGILFENNLPRYIRITDISLDGKLKASGALSLTEETAKGYILSNNDILFARSGATVGKAFIYKTEYGRAAFAGYLIRATVNEKIEPEFLFLYTQSSIYEEWKKQIFVQATIQNIGADRYSELPVVLPPIEEQQEVIRYLNDRLREIDRLIERKEKLLTEIETYKKSLIFEYVTGKKEVPE